MVIVTDCIGSYKSNYHQIMATACSCVLGVSIQSLSTIAAGTAYPSGAPELTRFLVGFVLFNHQFYAQSFVDRCLSLCPFYFGHCVVCPLIYSFRLPIWYLQTLLSMWHFLFWPLCCLSFFDLQLQITHLVSSNSSINVAFLLILLQFLVSQTNFINHVDINQIKDTCDT